MYTLFLLSFYKYQKATIHTVQCLDVLFPGAAIFVSTPTQVAWCIFTAAIFLSIVRLAMVGKYILWFTIIHSIIMIIEVFC